MVEIGETSVAIAVSALYLRQISVSSACRFAIDTLKEMGADLEEGTFRGRRGCGSDVRLASTVGARGKIASRFLHQA